jgi:IclR family acetate operon transcriptional repressor
MFYNVERSPTPKEIPPMLDYARPEANEPRIQSLARADAILTAVMSRPEPIGLGALSEAVGLNKTTVFNLAESLVVLGFLERTSQPKGYRLGLRCLELGRHVAKTLPLLEVSRPSLRELCQKTGETVNLAAPYLHEAIIIEALQSHHAVRATAYAGSRSNYHSSACGKAILAQFPLEQRQWLYASAGLKRMTEHTICDVDALEAELATVREKGFAIDNQENEIGAYCLAMPIFGPFNEIAGSISVSGVIQRMTPQLIDEVVALLQHHTGSISQALRRSSPGSGR